MRCVSLHARLNFVVKGSNVDNREDRKTVVTMSKCKAKKGDLTAAELKRCIEDSLLKELTVRYVDYIQKPEKVDYVSDVVIYDLCGYILKARPSEIECVVCRKTVLCDELELPNDFTADQFMALRSRGALLFVSVEIFKTFRVIVKTIELHLSPIGQIYIHNSFHICLEKSF